MIAIMKNALTSMEHMKDRIKSICIQKTTEQISTKYMNNSEHYEAYFAYFGWSILLINL